MASKNNNRQMVPEARQALDDMKFEIARELGVDVKGYGGDLTARENGAIGPRSSSSRRSVSFPASKRQACEGGVSSCIRRIRTRRRCRT